MDTLSIGIVYNIRKYKRHKVDKIPCHSRAVSKAELDALVREHDSVASDAGAIIQCALLDNPLKLY